MMVIIKIKRRRKQTAGQNPNVRPARAGLAVLALVCIGVAYWDLNYNSSDLPEPKAETAAVEVSAREHGAASTADDAAKERSSEAGSSGEAVSEAASGSASEAVNEAEAALFASYRLERENSREKELALLAEIISDPQVSSQAKRDAEARREQVAETVESETTAESLLAARGCGETVVLVSGDRATVVCRTELDGERAAQMAQVVSETCGISFENVVIVNQ